MWTWFRNDGLDAENDLGNLFVISTFPIISLLHRSHLQLINLAKIPETGDWRYWGMEIMGRHYHQDYHQHRHHHINHYHHHHHHQNIYTIIVIITSALSLFLSSYLNLQRVAWQITIQWRLQSAAQSSRPRSTRQPAPPSPFNAHHYYPTATIHRPKFYQIVCPLNFDKIPPWHIISSCWITIM